MQSRVLNGRYEIEEVLGRGGMATVYRARDLKLGRPVAIKVLHDYYSSDPVFLRRFEHEAQAAAGLSSHPNIIDVYDVGLENDLHYIVMEYVEGETLKDIIEREAPLPIEQSMQIAVQVAEGLAAAHRIGLVHRDIKPQNIIVSPDGLVRIADFGIAKGARSPGLTDPGMTFGTAEYISPEQVQGAPATPQSDIYSMGVVLYEMLTGHLPYTGDTPIAVAMQHVQGQPAPLRQLNPAIPLALEELVLQAMAKDPATRPASVRAFAQDLRSYREHGERETIVGPAVAPRGPYVQRPASAPQERPPRYPSGGEPGGRRRTPLPLPPAVEAPRRTGGNCGIFVLGLALLAGMLGLAYILFLTDFLDRVANIIPSGGGVTSPAGGPQATAQPTAPPGQVKPSPTVEATSVASARVPKVTGETDPNARRVIEEAGFRAHVTEPSHHPEVPQGFVISQEPPPDSVVPQGSVVTYTVSLGPELPDVRDLPDVTRQPFDVAKATLEGRGFKVARQDVPSREIQEGFVVSQNPGGGLRLPVGSNVVLSVSVGDKVRFPDVIGLDRAQAEQLIRQTGGLMLEIIDEQGPDRLGDQFNNFRPNEVISATANGTPVLNGQYVPRGSRIVLGVRRP